jgi:hypothetical protein
MQYDLNYALSHGFVGFINYTFTSQSGPDTLTANGYGILQCDPLNCPPGAASMYQATDSGTPLYNAKGKETPLD